MLIYSKEQLDYSNHDPRGQVLSYYLVNDSNEHLITCKLCGYTTIWNLEYFPNIQLHRSDAERHLLMCHLGVNWELENCECGKKHTWVMPDNYVNDGGLELFPNGFNMDLNRAYKEKHFPNLICSGSEEHD